MSKNKGLGQGVGLLFNEEVERFFECPVADIERNDHQPRSFFKEDELQELAQSIQENGIIQPLIVQSLGDQKYKLIAGERRLRASKLLGLLTVPVVVSDVDNETSLLELALIENIQRTDLTPIEEAEAYRKLIERFGYTQEETAQKVGKKRSTVTNLLRLLKLPENIKQDISEGILTEGHGRALVKLVNTPVDLQQVRNDIVRSNLSVRLTEKLIKRLSSAKQSKKTSRISSAQALPHSYKKALTTQLTNRLNSKVTIIESGNRGKVEIEYYSADDLDRVTTLILGE